MHTLGLMPGDNFKIGDYVYIIGRMGISKEGHHNVYFKKKLSIQDRINIKLGIPFSKVCPDNLNGYLYKITMVNKFDFDNELIENDFSRLL